MAQIVIHSICQPRITIVESREETARNCGMFGHTGK
jgi:dUTPase